MKRTAGEYAILLELLDQALDLPVQARDAWLEQLAEPYEGLRSTLRELLENEPGDASGTELSDQVAELVRGVATAPTMGSVSAGDVVGTYELLRELGQGGMGSVWLASRVDGAFKRTVALKLPHVTWVGGLAERMARERDILAGLEHPNIARLYDAGVDMLGRPFMALEYVEGCSIDVYCRANHRSLRDRLGLVLEVAKAVSYAHSKLVVHRDLKPSNILVTPQGDVRLLDFGIARLIASDGTAEAAITQFAGRLLTPDYASPEQIQAGPIGTPTDVYSLGVVTYELLAETRPYKLKRTTPAELERAIAETDPMLASDAAAHKARKRELRGDLDAILNKALKKNPAERYATVEAFAADLRRFLDGEPVLARPDSTVYRLHKFIGRNAVAFGAAAFVVIALVVATTFSMLQAREAKRQAETADVIKNFMLGVIAASDPSGEQSKPAAEMTAIELIDRSAGDLRTSMSTQPAVKLELLRYVGGVYERLDSVDKSLEVYREGVALADASLGPHSVQKADFLARIANVLDFGGRFPESERAVASAEAEFDAIGVHDSLIYAQLLKVKGNILRRKGPNGVLLAQATLQQAVAHFKSKFPDDDGYLGALMYLAGVQQSLDEMPAAKSTADTAVDISRKPFFNPSNVANVLSLRASVEDELGDFAAAQQDYAESSPLYAKSEGANNFLYIQNENFRGQSLHLSGQRDEGMHLLESTTAQISTVRANTNTHANCLTRLAEAYLRDGAFSQADASIQRALVIPAASQNISLHGRLLLDHAQALTGLGHFPEALAKVSMAVEVGSSQGPQSTYWSSETHLLLGAIAMAMRNLDESDRQLAQARRDSVGETRRVRRQRARIEALTARLAAARNDAAGALSAASIAEQLSGAPDIRNDVFVRSETFAALAAARCAHSPPDDGLATASEALTTRMRILRPGSPWIAESQIDLARCLGNSGKQAEAEQLLASAEQSIRADPSLGPQFAAAAQMAKAR